LFPDTRSNKEKVTFQWKDYKHKRKQNSKTMSVEASEFIRRFLLHTLPPGFQRIRHFGFLANCHRKPKLALCRQLLSPSITGLLPLAAQTHPLREFLAKHTPLTCPRCGIGAMFRVALTVGPLCRRTTLHEETPVPPAACPTDRRSGQHRRTCVQSPAHR
jgi:hypothetical protein